MVVGICRLSLYFPDSGSLKAKRHGLRKVKDRLRAKFNAAVAEVGGQDTWQRSSLGVAVVGSDNRHVQSMLDNITAFVEEQYVAQILDREVELLTYGQEEGFGGSGHDRAHLWEGEP